jgi:hypothetical protein
VLWGHQVAGSSPAAETIFTILRRDFGGHGSMAEPRIVSALMSVRLRLVTPSVGIQPSSCRFSNIRFNARTGRLRCHCRSGASREHRCGDRHPAPGPEAPEACKAIGPVIEAQEEEGFISAVARLRPWVTFKA